ncbi:hypothetical protein FNV43_RR12932 [Rhamnella rubrinervis]|uniref:Uncharacterized protein n=1 Tax=Rhamnella rubrinervis TaxID=2594499 RepID=A0A8K0H083_9ROSA|nr:hypothetical protein FNV43_RR12932 [Rhamnella rubrinervis]
MVVVKSPDLLEWRLGFAWGLAFTDSFIVYGVIDGFEHLLSLLHLRVQIDRSSMSLSSFIVVALSVSAASSV